MATLSPSTSTSIRFKVSAIKPHSKNCTGANTKTVICRKSEQGFMPPRLQLVPNMVVAPPPKRLTVLTILLAGMSACTMKPSLILSSFACRILASACKACKPECWLQPVQLDSAIVCILPNAGVLYLPPKPVNPGGQFSLSNLVPRPEDNPPQIMRPSSLTDDSTSEPDKDDQVTAPSCPWS